MYLVSIAIIIVNALSKTFLHKITKYYGYQSKSEKVNASTRNIFLLTFINSGIVIHLVYFGEFTGFSQKWYEEVGVTICITLFLITASYPASKLAE